MGKSQNYETSKILKSSVGGWVNFSEIKHNLRKSKFRKMLKFEKKNKYLETQSQTVLMKVIEI